jgi:hypothetical protein
MDSWNVARSEHGAANCPWWWMPRISCQEEQEYPSDLSAIELKILRTASTSVSSRPRTLLAEEDPTKWQQRINLLMHYWHMPYHLKRNVLQERHNGASNFFLQVSARWNWKLMDERQWKGYRTTNTSCYICSTQPRVILEIFVWRASSQCSFRIVYSFLSDK